jgi:hypothetical protein
MVGQEMPRSVGRDAVTANGAWPISAAESFAVEQEAFECSS